MNEDFGAGSDILVTLARRLVVSALSGMEKAPPEGVSRADIVSYRRRAEDALIAEIAEMMEPFRNKIVRRLSARGMVPGPQSSDPAATVTVTADPVTEKERTEANISAMTLLARAGGRTLTAAERATVGRYTGWGGLSLRGVEDRFPAGFPVPERRGLIHEYYTRQDVAQAVAPP